MNPIDKVINKYKLTRKDVSDCQHIADTGTVKRMFEDQFVIDLMDAIVSEKENRNE